jgi:branched-chain amino acid transport system substrate-binding protein
VAGKHYKLKVLERDTRSDSAVAVTDAQELVRDSQVIVMFGTELGTGVPTIPITQKAGIVHFMAPSNVEPELDKDTNCCLFRSSISNKYRDPVWLKAAGQQLQSADPSIKTVAFVLPNDANFRALAQTWGNFAESSGLHVVDTKFFQAGTTDFSGIISSLAGTRPDVIFGPPLIPQAQAIIRQATEQRVGKGFIFPAIPQSIAKDALGRGIPQPVVTLWTGQQFAQPSTDKLKQFIKDYQAWRGGQMPQQVAESVLFFYDSVSQWTKALQKAGCVPANEGSSSGPNACQKKVVQALVSNPYEGIRGSIQYDSTHRVKYPIDACVTIGEQLTCKSYNT